MGNEFLDKVPDLFEIHLSLHLVHHQILSSEKLNLCHFIFFLHKLYRFSIMTDHLTI